MDAAEAWHELLTHCREFEVERGSARIRINVTDAGWHTLTRSGDGRTEKAEGTHTHDLLVYLAYLSQRFEAPTGTPQGGPLGDDEALWVSRSSWSTSYSSADGARRLRIHDASGPDDIVALIDFHRR